MKKTFIIILVAFAGIAANAQTWSDAYTLGQNDYFGTARTIGIGNAVTAVGGDLGTIGINPAGSAVMGYSQVTITPGVTIGASSTSFSATSNDPYSNKQNNSIGRFNVPNFGVILNFSTGNRSGLKSISYGVVVNKTNKFNTKILGRGINSSSSYLGYLATYAGDHGYDVDILNGYRTINGEEIDDAYYAYDQGYAPWDIITNAQSSAIAPYGNYYDKYMGATEVFSADSSEIYLGGPIEQTYGRKVTGGKNDIIFNIGFNFSDRFYLGANLGITSLDYDYSEYIKEYAQNTGDFPINPASNVYFDNYRGRYSYSIEGAGVYGKFGFIAIPIEGLRIGAAIQTPTVFSLTEKERFASDVHYTNSEPGVAYSPQGEYDYRLRTPYIINAGLAYTFEDLVLLSVDYEFTDNSVLKFKEDNDNSFYYGDYDDINQDIRDFVGNTHALRIGAEFKPVSDIAIRAGYNYTVTPLYDYLDNVKNTFHDEKNAFSLGLGYSSPGSFFCDLAARYTMWRDQYYSLYDDYLGNGTNPYIKTSPSRWDIVMTFGWRF